MLPEKTYHDLSNRVWAIANEMLAHEKDKLLDKEDRIISMGLIHLAQRLESKGKKAGSQSKAE